MTPTPDDLLAAAVLCRRTLTPALDRDWSTHAGDLDWDCRRTLDHIPDALILYAAHLATAATARLPRVRDGDPNASVGDLLLIIEAASAMLVAVVRAAPAGSRAFHPAGRADASGFLAMGCAEILIHTDDIALGLELPFRPPNDLTDRVLRRLFPWAPTDGDVWAVLRWACGRAALPDRARLAPDWYWHCAPLAEWDGTIKKRSSPPGWT